MALSHMRLMPILGLPLVKLYDTDFDWIDLHYVDNKNIRLALDSFGIILFSSKWDALAHQLNLTQIMKVINFLIAQ